MRLLGALGALLAATAVAGAAYASHAASTEDAQRLFIASAFAFGHGVALLMLTVVMRGRLAAIALAMLAAGTLLFTGSLAGAALAGLPTPLAPAGGMLLILGWCIAAVARLRS